MLEASRWGVCLCCMIVGRRLCFLKHSSWEFVWASSFILVEIFQLFNYAVCANIKRGHAGVCTSTMNDVLLLHMIHCGFR